MADYPSALGEFDAEWLPDNRLGWPDDGQLSANAPLRFQPGDRVVLRLHRATRRRPWRLQPVHEELCVELEPSALEVAAGERMELNRLVYQAGTEIMFFRSTTARGAVTVLDRVEGELVLGIALTFEQPVADVDGLGTLMLEGRVRVALPARVH